MSLYLEYLSKSRYPPIKPYYGIIGYSTRRVYAENVVRIVVGRLNNDRADIDHLTRVLVLCGTPTEETMSKVTSQEARNYIHSLPPLKKKNFKEVFQGANPLAIDLLELMLELDAEKRITAEQALAHHYLSQYADPTDEPISLPYDQSFEDMELPVDKWKELVYHEVVNFVPQQQVLPSS